MAPRIAGQFTARFQSKCAADCFDEWIYPDEDAVMHDGEPYHLECGIAVREEQGRSRSRIQFVEADWA